MLEFLKVKEDHLEMILKWRVTPEVTRYMFTDMEYDLKKQKEWFERVSKDNDYKQWLISNKNTPIGLVYLKDINWDERYCYTGFYIGDFKHSIVSATVLAGLYNNTFFQLGLNKLYAAVMEGNEDHMKFHQMHGFHHHKTMKKHIEKYGKLHDVHVFMLTKRNWISLERRFGKYVFNFPD